MEPKRIVVIDRDRCRPKKCNYVCMRVCPPQRSGVEVFIIDEETKFPIIDESLCIGCGICVKYCPFHALTIVNLPTPVEEEIVHRYGPNAFSLYRLPIPVEGKVVGLLGQNGTGKTTSLKILSGLLKPNLGRYNDPPDWDEIIEKFKGSMLHEYFEKLRAGDIKTVYKPQYVDVIPKIVKGDVKSVLKKYDEKGISDELITELKMENFLNRQIKELSGGELQKLAIAVAIEREGDIYLFDEPSSYLDVLERMRIAKVIRRLAEKEKKYVLVAEHDLAILDYISDTISIYYGEPGAFGIVSHPKGVREGINIFLDGYIPDENVRFRETPIKFKIYAPQDVSGEKELLVKYPSFTKTLDSFKLEVEGGEIRKGEVIGILGPNGIGKTTFIKVLAGIFKPDQDVKFEGVEKIEISYKPQYLMEFVGEDDWMTVSEKIESVRKGALSDKWFRTYVVSPLKLEKLFDQQLGDLSGGELQKVAIATALAKKADLYLLDEPSAYISAEDRFWIAKVIRSIVESSDATVVVVEHDILVADYMTDRLLIFEGEPGIHGVARGPFNKLEGMNRFLEKLGITFRRDKTSGRPRINKPGSKLDIQQKRMRQYYYVA